MSVNRPRMFWPAVLSVVSMLACWALAPQLIGATLYKFATISAAGWGAYWLDREMSPYARPHRYLADLHAGRAAVPDALGFGVPAQQAAIIYAALAIAAQIRRAMVVIGAMVCAALVV